MKIVKVKCSGCDGDMDCPESMLNVNKHFCDICVDLMVGGVEESELKENVKFLRESGVIEATEFAEQVAGELADTEFEEMWKEDHQLLEKVPKNDLAAEMYYQGVNKVLQILVNTGMGKDALQDLLDIYKALKSKDEKTIEKILSEKLPKDEDVSYIG